MKTIVKLVSTLSLCIILTACISSGKHLSRKQVKMLEAQGFQLEKDGWTLGLPERLLFSFNSADVNPDYVPQIKALSDKLMKYKIKQAKIVGHTDDIGSAEYNQKLSQQRAEHVADVFKQSGYTKDNLEVIGRGMESPLVPNTSDENRAINRRVTVIISP